MSNVAAEPNKLWESVGRQGKKSFMITSKYLGHSKGLAALEEERPMTYLWPLIRNSLRCMNEVAII